MTEEQTAKMGRPKKHIDFEVAEKLAYLMATQQEISDFFDIDQDTLNARIKERYDMTFSQWYKKNSAGGKMSLRRHQFKAAENGNATMLIWLGKQNLGQTDKIETYNSEGRAPKEDDRGGWQFKKEEDEE